MFLQDKTKDKSVPHISIFTNAYKIKFEINRDNACKFGRTLSDLFDSMVVLHGAGFIRKSTQLKTVQLLETNEPEA